MRLIFLFLLFSLSIHSWSKADNISEFEIEGMSLEESLLNHFDENKIIANNLNYIYHNDKFYAVAFYKENFYETYESLEIHLKKNDKNYKIYAIDGLIFYDEINQCHKKQDEIIKDINNLLENTKMIDLGVSKMSDDITGKSSRRSFYWELDNGNIVAVECYDWSEEIFQKNSWYDNLRISIVTKELNNWLTN